MKPRKTRKIMVGGVGVGGDAPISVQSMTNTDTGDVKATLKQLRSLYVCGAQILRVAVPDAEAARAIAKIKPKIKAPLVADIHFNYRLALASLRAGADAVRINPGNIGGKEKVKAVVKEAAQRGKSLRVGVNSGSLQKKILKRYGSPCAEALVESALEYVKILEDMNFYNFKISIKSSDVLTTINVYREISRCTHYPLHLGLTASGTSFAGSIRSSVALGVLLYEGIGDTIRVSLSAPPEDEVRAGIEILQSLGLRKPGVMVIACPTCARCNADVEGIAKRIEKKIFREKASMRVAVMGCEVNGPGEAREADLGVAAGKGCALIFKKGKILKKVSTAEMEPTLLEEFYKIVSKPRA